MNSSFLMVKKFLPTLLFFIGSCYQLIAQTNDTDTFYAKKMAFYRDVNNDSLYFYASKLAKSTDVCFSINAVSEISYFYYKKKEYAKSKEVCLRLLNRLHTLIATKKNISCLIDTKILCFNRLFWIHKNLENFKEAYQCLINCEEAIREHPTKSVQNFRDNLGVIINKAAIKNKLGMHEEAKSILINAYATTSSSGLINTKKDETVIRWKANLFNSLGDTYLALNEKTPNAVYLDSANYYFDKSFAATKEFTPIHKDSEIIYHFRKTNVLVAKKEYQKAIDLINSFSSISNGYDYHRYEAFQKTICFFHLNQADSTIQYANAFLNDKTAKSTHSNLIRVYDILSNQYHKLRKIDSAFKYSKLTLNEFNVTEHSKEETYPLLYKNNFERARALNELIVDKNTKSKYKIFYFFGIFIGISGVLLFVFFKKEKKEKEVLVRKINNKPNEEKVAKKEYNIDKALEEEVLAEIERIDTSFEFLAPTFSINVIADKLQTNSTYVSFIFNKNKEISFKQYYAKLKIDYIVKKLETDATYRKYAIQALAEEVGYTNASAFTRAFKKQKGSTPSAFLNSLK
ncbi:conserved exported hypothetical protein [Tenacibaculum maritimum]|uniref:helix-turn-helix domain-containing protein n=1 Tax=Tenacibaculum maritimum TaxID=107401 RepID=UPI0012E599E0|nr:AraC family transcriptional regulator [Tenacibaculum maritimum]CAA0147611.1 conserved exported hypothetical protein [Tenacibaculum maritimum]